MPCDLDCFMDEYPKWQGSWCLIVCGVILKEPGAVKTLAQSAVASAAMRGEACSADMVFSTLQDAARAAGECGGASVWGLTQITRQCVARFMGVASVLQAMGVIEADGDGKLVLGMLRKRFRLVDACTESVTAFATACSKHQSRFSALVGAAASLQGTAADVRTDGGRLATFCSNVNLLISETLAEAGLQCGQYAGKSAARKVVVAAVATGQLGTVSWYNVTVADLVTMCPDQKSDLDAFPGKMTAADASDIVFDRPDRALFLSMWNCLFGDKELMKLSDHDKVAVEQRLSNERRHCSVPSCFG